jgi:hypothetical protein
MSTNVPGAGPGAVQSRGLITPSAPAHAAAAVTNAPRAPSPETKKLSDVTFRSFTEHGLSEEMLKLIPYEFCSEVQAATLEPILKGKDV